MNSLSEQINHLLPQTQCRECGYTGCAPYAQALANNEAAINLCSAGGEIVMLDIAQLLNKPAQPPEKIQHKALAWIDESQCIGCTACIRACPVDAIMGASKYMHTVLADECTGCGLCVTPCPVDCIHMLASNETFLPRARQLSQHNEPRFAAASHAQARYEWHETRKARDLAEKKALIKAREDATKVQTQATQAINAINKPSFNPNDLIARAMQKAAEQQSQAKNSIPSNHEAFKEQQIKEAQQRATFRRAQRDARYGNDKEKAAAIEWLRQYKAEQDLLKEQNFNS